MSTFAKPVPDVTCPDCGAQGTIGGSGMCNFRTGPNPDTSTVIFNCKCGKEIAVSRDQVAVSSDPLFQAIGMLGSAKGMIQPADNVVLEKVTLQNPDGTTTVSHKGHLTITVLDPETGETRQIPVEVGGKQELLVTPGIHRDLSLPRPADKVFVLALKVMEPSDVGDSMEHVA